MLDLVCNSITEEGSAYLRFFSKLVDFCYGWTEDFTNALPNKLGRAGAQALCRMRRLSALRLDYVFLYQEFDEEVLAIARDCARSLLNCKRLRDLSIGIMELIQLAATVTMRCCRSSQNIIELTSYVYVQGLGDVDSNQIGLEGSRLLSRMGQLTNLDIRRNLVPE